MTGRLAISIALYLRILDASLMLEEKGGFMAAVENDFRPSAE